MFKDLKIPVGIEVWNSSLNYDKLNELDRGASYLCIPLLLEFVERFCKFMCVLMNDFIRC